ncbi:hypothetical protein CK224_25680 [Mesorhizobium sp. WSM3862]|nr:hypothetical protein CK224_25680 [Mesorhizobium sp. WSM3862]
MGIFGGFINEALEGLVAASPKRKSSALLSHQAMTAIGDRRRGPGFGFGQRANALGQAGGAGRDILARRVLPGGRITAVAASQMWVGRKRRSS